jgi:NADH:ubiquinone oxidoreductase subunit 4 (subunit M)
MALAVIGIIYGALVAMIQPDMKKLVAICPWSDGICRAWDLLFH